MSDQLLLGLELRGKPVLCIGGGAVGTRRARTFVDAGALVTVVAPDVSEELARLAQEGVLTWHRRAFRTEDLDQPWLVHVAAHDPQLGAHVAEEAHKRRIFCITTADAARGSAHLPARATFEVRGEQVNVGVTSGDPRRSMSIRDRLRDALATTALDLRPRRRRGKAGWVALIGGGPGDPDLLTSRARTLLSAADVVLADRLAPQQHSLLCPQAEVIDVGKAPGRHAMTQDEINELLVRRAREGLGVVRLKGGDPYVFGRGGEERLACEEAGVEVQVVPGVTSALAGPAAAGIPLTHRGIATGFSIVEGHDLHRSGVRDTVAGGRDHTLVILMGVRTLAGTASLLAAGGRGPDCPVAIVERASMPDQRVTAGTLGTIADRAAAVGVVNPAVIVVGDVVTLAHSWTAFASESLAAAV